MPYIKLKQKRKIRGTNYPVGVVVEVSETLADKLKLNGFATKSNEKEFEAYKTASNDYKKLNKADLIGYATSLDIEVPGDANKDDIYLLIEDKFKEVENS
mgnify:CR=1 FL=1